MGSFPTLGNQLSYGILLSNKLFVQAHENESSEWPDLFLLTGFYILLTHLLRSPGKYFVGSMGHRTHENKQGLSLRDARCYCWLLPCCILVAADPPSATLDTKYISTWNGSEIHPFNGTHNARILTQTARDSDSEATTLPHIVCNIKRYKGIYRCGTPHGCHLHRSI